jgi:hypothetical protein
VDIRRDAMEELIIQQEIKGGKCMMKGKMSIKPILFNTEMVRAILNGRKTVTRRIIKPHNVAVAKRNNYQQRDGLWIDFTTDNPDNKGHIKDYSVSPCWSSIDYYINHYAPYQIDDILYVRETWMNPCEECTCIDCNGCIYGAGYRYKVDYRIKDDIEKWRPSIHMPKEAARIWLKVTNVRVERLQDITDDQAKAEGANCKDGKNIGIEEKMSRTAIDRFKEIWDSTIKKSDIDRYGWDANPWVWVIEFERCEKPEG